MMQKVCLMGATLVYGAVVNGQQGQGSERSSNGNVAYSFTKDFIQHNQALFQKLLMKESEELELHDLRIQQKTEQGRLTSLISSIKLQEIDLEEAQFTVDFINNNPSPVVANCETDFDMILKFTGVSMVFEFDQWFETESSSVTEEAARGEFHLPNMTFTLQAMPYVN